MYKTIFVLLYATITLMFALQTGAVPRISLVDNKNWSMAKWHSTSIDNLNLKKKIQQTKTLKCIHTDHNP